MTITQSLRHSERSEESLSLPAGWLTQLIEQLFAPLEDERTLHQGWSPQCEKEPSPSEDVWGVLKTTSIQAGEFQPEHNKRLPDKLAPRPLIEVKEGDILVTCAGPRARCGVACLVRRTRKRLMMSGKMYRFRVDPKRHDARYVEAFLQTEQARQAIDKMKTGGSDSGLNLTHDRFRQLPVPVAPLPEQRRIVGEIEKQFTRLEAGVAALRRVQANLHRYRAAVLKAACEGRLVAADITGWRDATFGEVCRVQCGFAFKSTDYQQSGIPLIRIASLVDGEVALDAKTAYLPASFVDEYAAFALKKGDVLIAMSGATTGKMGTFNLDTPALLNQRVGRFQIKTGNFCNARFMALIVEQIKQQVIRDAYGAAQPNISPKQIESMPFRFPPLAEQERIVAEVERRLSVVEELSALVESNLKRATRLRQSVLQEAFAGRLVK
ncbi:MAG: hypothetical protein FJ395_18240 [Verrucomicrobia bacterium]|nr:hypothetical protein [Verrucomicrobiota bacterium]